MDCRVGCAACCIAPSISSPIPGMPNGKPAGIRCIQLTDDGRCLLFGKAERPSVCLLFGKAERPSVCLTLRPTQEMCRSSTAEALQYLTWLEGATKP